MPNILKIIFCSFVSGRMICLPFMVTILIFDKLMSNLSIVICL